MERVPIKSNPKLFDKVIVEIQQGLFDNLKWLNYSFGRVERLIKQINGRKYYTPNIYIGNNEYALIGPDSGFGNISFFVLDEPQDVEWAIGDRTHLSTPFSLIVWFDIRTIEQTDERNTEYVKQKILQLLNGGLFLRNGRITINRIYEKAENIFKGFSLAEIDNQFLMQPFAGFRFEGEMSAATECDEVIPPIPETPYISGHITNGASSFTFIVNGENVTVPVGVDGNWKWEQNVEITSLQNAFNGITNLDTAYLKNVKTSGSCRGMFQGCTVIDTIILDNSLTNTSSLYNFAFVTKLKKIIVKNSAFNNVTTCYQAFEYCDSVSGLENSTFANCTNMYRMFLGFRGETLDLSKCEIKSGTNVGGFLGDPSGQLSLPIKNFKIGKVEVSISFSACPYLTAQSIISLFNAVAADNLTFTFHPTVGAMIDAALQDPANYIYQAYWAADARGYHINYIY